jgi:hypothetical protein
MILKDIEVKIMEKMKGEFIYPSYEKYCFSSIPSTISKIFNIKIKRPALPQELYETKIKNANKVILFLVDGFGYNQWLRHSKEFRLFDSFNRKGIISPITAIFPSTTAAAITTMNTGLTPQEHALIEWVLYFKEINMLINTLPFMSIDGKNQDELLEKGVNPEILYNGKTFHQDLKEQDIKSFTFINKSYSQSCYSKQVYKGSITIPFVNLSDLIVRLRKTIENEKGQCYFYVYLGDMDSIEHQYGPSTEEQYAEISMLAYMVEKELIQKIDNKAAKETALILTSDHGQVNVTPKETFYLNKYKNLVNNFQRDKKNRPILPTGGPRDVFLHIEPKKLEETHTFLSTKLKEKAKVLKVDEEIKNGLFGLGKPKKEFYDRAGNLLVLPIKNHTVWYEHIKNKKFNLLGHHGGLSKDEMLIPFGISMLSDLK